MVKKSNENKETNIFSKIKQFSFKKKIFLIYLGFSFIFLVYFTFLSGNVLFLIIKDIFVRNLGFFAINMFWLWSVILIGLIFIILSSFGVIFSLYKRKLNWWVLGTVSLMVFFFLQGVIFLDTTSGNKGIDLKLYENGSVLDEGRLICTGNIDRTVILINDIIYCTSKPKLENMSGTISFIFKNKTTYQLFFEGAFTFNAPLNVKAIFFKFEGIDADNKTRVFDVWQPHTFITEQQYEENKKIFITYIFALFGVVFFSIPNLMVNFKKLSEKPKKSSKKKD